MDFSLLFIKMVIFAVLLMTGYVAARKGFLAPDFAKSASWLLMHVFLVASIIHAVLGERPTLSGKELWFTLLLLTGSFVLFYLFGTIFSKFSKSDTAPMVITLFGAMNNMFVGLPVIQTVFGNEAAFYMALSNVPFNLILYTYGAWHLNRGKGMKGIQWKKMISFPLVASVLALLIFVLDWRAPRLVTEFFSTVSAATVPVSMLIIGATLGPVSLKDAFRGKGMYLFCLVKLVVFPVVVYFLLRGFVHNPVLLISCVVLAGCPSGAVNTPLAIQYEYDAEYVSQMILVTTACSIVTLPAILYFLV